MGNELSTEERETHLRNGEEYARQQLATSRAQHAASDQLIQEATAELPVENPVVGSILPSQSLDQYYETLKEQDFEWLESTLRMRCHSLGLEVQEDTTTAAEHSQGQINKETIEGTEERIASSPDSEIALATVWRARQSAINGNASWPNLDLRTGDQVTNATESPLSSLAQSPEPPGPSESSHHSKERSRRDHKVRRRVRESSSVILRRPILPNEWYSVSKTKWDTLMEARRAGDTAARQLLAKYSHVGRIEETHGSEATEPCLNCVRKGHRCNRYSTAGRLAFDQSHTGKNTCSRCRFNNGSCK